MRRRDATRIVAALVLAGALAGPAPLGAEESGPRPQAPSTNTRPDASPVVGTAVGDPRAAAGAPNQGTLLLDMPVACAPGADCFLQQYPDMDPGPGVADPFCGSASYPDHNGVDIRVLSMRDLARNVAVLAMADGVVLRGRDGVADRLARDEETRAAVADHECGNGLVVDFGGGLEAQYCHMKEGSLTAEPGTFVRRGERLGALGASGLAAFPHLHVTLRKNGVVVDPFTGRPLNAGCLAEGEPDPLWNAEARRFFQEADTHVLAFGLTGGKVSYERLVEDGPPPVLTLKDQAIVGWGWFANLLAGDRVSIRIAAPGGELLTDALSEPLARTQAASMQFSGRARPPGPGRYRLQIAILRAGETIEMRESAVELR